MHSARQRTRVRESTNPDFIDEQFKMPERTAPKKAIALAVGLFTLGTILLTVAGLLFTGEIADGKVEHDERLIPLFVLGSICFIPGAYHVRIAFWAWRGADGYDWTLIPDMD